MSKYGVVLCMIVKDESAVIQGCLESVAPHIDAFCIVDTGSTDNTISVIREFFAARGIPGVVHERAWKDFGSNRSEAIQLAHEVGEYALVMDADDLLHGQVDFHSLTADSYLVQITSESLTYWRQQLFSARKKWRYEGVVHEYPTCDDPSVTVLRQPPTWWIESRRVGARNLAADKYQRDANLLLADLEVNPGNPRSVFYLAQSYFDMGDYEKSLSRYVHRAAMGGWDEEVFYSKMRTGLCLINLERPRGEILDALLGAWEFRPTRAEPLYHLAQWHREQSMFQQAVLFARAGTRIAMPADDILFVAADVYSWRLKDELAISAYYTGEFHESLRLCVDLLRNTLLPVDHRARVERNLQLATSALSAGASASTGVANNG